MNGQITKYKLTKRQYKLINIAKYATPRAKTPNDNKNVMKNTPAVPHFSLK
jgi:hypothetical protein